MEASYKLRYNWDIKQNPEEIILKPQRVGLPSYNRDIFFVSFQDKLQSASLIQM